MGCNASTVVDDVIVLEGDVKSRSEPRECTRTTSFHIASSDATTSSPTYAASSECSAGDGVHSSVQLMGNLGRGAFAQVYAGRIGNAQIAVKVSEIQPGHKRGTSPSGLQYASRGAVEKEADILKRVANQPNCLTTFGSFIEGGVSYILMERCDTTTLSFFEGQAKLSTTVMRPFFKQVFQALDTIHRLGVVHRDIKPDNFLISTSRGGRVLEDGFEVKLCDFGLSAVRGVHAHSGVYGTAPFMSPEMVKGLSHDNLTDVWSVGAVMYTFFFGRFPYNPKVANAQEMKETIRMGLQPISFRPSSLDTDGLPAAVEMAVPMLKLLLCRDRKLRPQAQDALKCEWFTCSSLDNGEHNFGPCFNRAKRLGVFDIRNAAPAQAKNRRTPLEQRLTDMQQENFPRTAQFCTRPFKEVLALDEVQKPVQGKNAFASDCSTYTGGDISPASSVRP